MKIASLFFLAALLFGCSKSGDSGAAPTPASLQEGQEQKKVIQSTAPPDAQGTTTPDGITK